ncbi:MAG: hypothetical protein KA103_02845 [Saprospiraceae bacterium]|nr:hypothetical protein [Saprospiraceae bacterium]
MSANFKKGDISMSGAFTMSGTNKEKPREKYTDPEGAAKFTKIGSFSGDVSYALNDNWVLSAKGSTGNHSNSTTIERITTSSYETELLGSGFLTSLIAKGIVNLLTGEEIDVDWNNIESSISTVGRTPIGEVHNAYNYWAASIAGGRKFFKTDKQAFCLFGGMGMGKAVLIGTTHANGQGTYLNSFNVQPLTYGEHQNRYYNFFLQPTISFFPSDFVEFGLHSRLMMNSNHVNTKLIIDGLNMDLGYDEQYTSVLMQPGASAYFGNKSLKVGLDIATLIPISNPTKEHYNKFFVTMGIRYTLPTIK